MSTDFTLAGPRFDRSTWQNRLRQLLRGETPWKPLACMGQIFPGAGQDAPLADRNLILLGEGSTRGASVEINGDKVSLGLRTLASKPDWEVIRWLLATGREHGAVAAGEEKTELDDAELAPAAFHARAQQLRTQEIALTRKLAVQDDSDIRLPVAHFELRLTKEELATLNDDALMERLIKLCYQFGNAWIAKVMELQAKDGPGIRFAHYSSRATLFPADVGAVTFGGPDGVYTEDPVPLEHVRKVLGEFLIPTAGYLYLPPIHWDKQPALLEAVTGRSTQEILAALQQQLMESLVRAPVWVFMLMAGADGTADEKETSAFLEHLRRAAADEKDKSTFASAARGLLPQLREVMASFKKGTNPAAELQLAIGQVDHRFAAEAGLAFKQRLYELAEVVCKASGGGVLGLGSKISKEEQAGLDWLKKVLSLENPTTP